MNDQQKKMLKKYQALKNSPMFINLLNDIDASLDKEVHPALSDVIDPKAEKQYKNDIFSLPVGQEGELKNIPTEDLLRATKDIVKLLKQDIPQNLSNLDEQEMDEIEEGDDSLKELSNISKLPIYLTQISKVISEKVGEASMGIENVLPANMSLKEFRLLNTAESVLSDVHLITETLYNQGEIDANLDNQITSFNLEKHEYRQKQEDLQYRVAETKQKLNGLEYQEAIIDEKGNVVQGYDDLVENLDDLSTETSFYDIDYLNKFANNIATLNTKIETWENLRGVKEVEIEENFNKEIDDYNAKYDEEEEQIRSEYESDENELHTLEVTFEKAKKLNDYKPYNDFENAVYDFKKLHEEKNTKVDKKYLRYSNDLGEVEFCTDEDPDFYISELEKIDEEIAEIENTAKADYKEAEEAVLNFKSAKEASELRAGLVLKKEKEDVEKTISVIKALTDNKLIVASGINDEQVKRFSPQLKKTYDECVAKQIDTTFTCGEFEKKYKDTKIFESLKNVVHTIKNSVEPIAKKTRDPNLNAITSVLKAEEVNTAFALYQKGVTTGFADGMNAIGNAQIPILSNLVNERLKNKNLAKDERKALNTLSEQLKEFNKEFDPMKKDIKIIQDKKDDYIDKAKEFHSQLVQEHDKKFLYNTEIAELIKKAENADKDIKPVSEEYLTQLKEKNDYFTNKYQNTKDNLDYLKSCKKAYEASKNWYAFKPGINDLYSLERIEKLKNRLDERDTRINNAFAAKEENVKQAKKMLEEAKAKNNKRFDDGRQYYEEGKKNCEQGKFYCDRVKRNLDDLEKRSGNLVKSKDAIITSYQKELDNLAAMKKAQHEKHIQKEDTLLENVLKSKKKVGFDSAYFKNVKTEIENYKKLRDENGNIAVSAAVYKQQTSNLLTSLDDYISNRKGEKITDAGYVRLDYVRQLKRNIETHQKFLETVEAKTAQVTSKEPKIDIEMKLQIEERIFKNIKGDPELKNKFFDTISFDEALLKAQEASGLFNKKKPEDFNPERTQMLIEEDIAEETRLREEKAKKEAEKAAKEKELAEKKAKAEAAGITDADFEINYIKPVIPDLQAALKGQPMDLHNKIEEFNRIMSNVPNDYGFQEFNKDKNVFTKWSMDKYIKENKAAEMFMKMNNIHNPMLSPADAKKVVEFDAKMSGALVGKNNDIGYNDYVIKYTLTHRDLKSMDEDRFLSKKQYEVKYYGFTGNVEDSLQDKDTELRHKAAIKQGIQDPRDTIPHYGKIYMDDKVVEQMKAAQEKKINKDFELANKINNEIAKYEKAMKNLKPDYGFKPDPYYDKELYHTLGLDRKYYMKKNNITDVREYYKDEIEKNKTTESMKQKIAEFDKKMSKMKPYCGYNEMKKESVELQRAKYIKSCDGIILQMKEKNIVDPRLTYAKEIKASEYLTKIFAPEQVEEMTPSYTNMSQLDAIDDVDDYDKAGAEIVNYSVKFKDVYENNEYDPLSLKNVSENSDIEKYPKDLQEKIREYDQMLSMIPNGYGYKQFERECDVEGKISEKQYTESGMGKKFFAHKHRMQDPRIDLAEAEKINEFDKSISGFKFDKTIDDFSIANDEKFAKYELKSAYNIARDKYIIEHHKGVDPRENIPQYGRIFLKKDEYKAPEIFDESKRYQKHDAVIAEVKQFVKNLDGVKLAYGWQQFEYGKGMDIEQYRSKKEYALEDLGIKAYIKDKGFENPLEKYSTLLENDPELRLKVDAEMKPFRDYVAGNKEAISKMQDSRAEKEFIVQREIEQEKTKTAYNDLKKEEDGKRKEFYNEAMKYMPIRLNALKTSQLDNARQEAVEKVAEQEAALTTLVNNYNNYFAEGQHEIRVQRLQSRRYADKLTIKDYQFEKKLLDEKLVDLNAKYGKNVKPADNIEVYDFTARKVKLNQLQKLIENEKTKEMIIKRDGEHLKNHPELLEAKLKAENQKKEKATSEAKIDNAKKSSNKSVSDKNISAPEKDGPHK